MGKRRGDEIPSSESRDWRNKRSEGPANELERVKSLPNRTGRGFELGRPTSLISFCLLDCRFFPSKTFSLRTDPWDENSAQTHQAKIKTADVMILNNIFSLMLKTLIIARYIASKKARRSKTPIRFISIFVHFSGFEVCSGMAAMEKTRDMKENFSFSSSSFFLATRIWTLRIHTLSPMHHAGP